MSVNVGVLDDSGKAILSENLAKEKEKAEATRIIRNMRKNSIETRAARIELDIASATAEIAVYDQIIGGLPDGNLKTEMQDKKRTTENRLWSLQKSRERQGMVEVVQLEIEIQELTSKIGLYESLITQLA